MRKTENFPRGEFRDRLDQLLAAASRAGISDSALAESLHRCADALAVRAAMRWVHPSVPPKYASTGGNGSLVERLKAAIKGEYALKDGQ
jgi:hypothetical protein